MLLLAAVPARAQTPDLDPNAMAVGIGIAINNMAQFAVRQKNRADQLQAQLDAAQKEMDGLRLRCGAACEPPKDAIKQ